MATAVPNEVACSLVKDGILELEHREDLDTSNYSALAVLPHDMLMLIDGASHELHLHCLKSGRLLDKFKNLQSKPRNLCRCVVQTGETKVAVALKNGQVQILKVLSATIIPERTLDLSREFAMCLGVKAIHSGTNLLVSGLKDGWFYWSTVSIVNGHVNNVHKICQGMEWTYLATSHDDSIVYISCLAGLGSPNNGVYAFHINTGSNKFVYQSKELNYPSGISVDKDGFIYVCNYSSGIHQLTERGELLTVHLVVNIYGLYAIDWDEERQYFYITSIDKNEVMRLRPVFHHSNQQDTPVEILRMDDKSIQLYKRALQDGKEKVYNIRVMVVGQYGVGKTTLTKRLLGQPVDISETKPTEGIDVYNHCCRISLDTGEWRLQHEDSNQLLPLQRIVKLLTDTTERAEVTDEQEGHGETNNISNQSDSHDDDNVDHDFSNCGDDAKVAKSDSGVDQPQTSSSTETERNPQARHPSTPLACDPSSDDNPKNGKHENSKGDATMAMLQRVNENALKLNQSKLEHAELTIWDFAGQQAFYTTHQTFLSHRAIYLLVTDLSQQFTDVVRDDQCYFDTEGLQSCKVQDLVDLWFSSIHSCASSPSAVSPITFPAFSLATPDIGVPPTPPVIIVGTHVDKIPEDERQEVINKYVQQICCILKDKPTLQHLVKFFPIDNTKIDPQLDSLKTRIFQLASKQKYWGEEVPAKWILLEEELKKLKASGEKVIPRMALEKIIDERSVPIEKNEELDLCLRFLHETGTIIYFSIEVLRMHIVLDPKLLIDALKCLINAQQNPSENLADNSPQSATPADSSSNSAITMKWFDFKEKGILTLELVDAVWIEKIHPDLHAHRDHILLIMEQLSIIAKPRSLNEIGAKEENFYLTPCMLRLESPKEVIFPEQDPQMVSTPVLRCVFTGRFLPPAVFHRLLAACVARWPVAKKKQTSENLIFCGCCVFELDLFHRLTLYMQSHVVSARITRMVLDEVNRPDAKLCSRVRRFITLNLTKITSYLGQNLQYELHVCPPIEMWLADEGYDPDAPITREHMNHARLCVALVTICGKAMREILLTNFPVPYQDIYQVILANRFNLTRRQGRPLLNPAQIQLVFPDPQGQTTGTVDQFDISLLYILIRNISAVPPPITGWGNDPQDQPRDTSMGASVERIRSYRNDIGAHSPNVQINHQDFEDSWNKISLVIHDIEAVFGTQVYSAQLERQRRQVISVYEAC